MVQWPYCLTAHPNSSLTMDSSEPDSPLKRCKWLALCTNVRKCFIQIRQHCFLQIMAFLISALMSLVAVQQSPVRDGPPPALAIPVNTGGSIRFCQRCSKNSRQFGFSWTQLPSSDEVCTLLLSLLLCFVYHEEKKGCCPRQHVLKFSVINDLRFNHVNVLGMSSILD